MNADRCTRDIQTNILAALADIDVIDAHEHLGPEEDRTRVPVDVFSLFMVDRLNMEGDLAAAGMTDDESRHMSNADLPLATRWSVFRPYWERVRHTSSSRAALVTIQRFFGCDDLNDGTYAAISAAMQKANQPGIYDRILRDACRIRAAITQCGTTQTGSPLLVPVVPIVFACEEPSWRSLTRPMADHLGGMRGYESGWRGHPVFAPGTVINTLDDYLAAVEDYIARTARAGAVGVKMYALPSHAPSRQDALAAFSALKEGHTPNLKEYADNPLRDYVWDRAISVASELGLVMAVHAGFGGDFRYLNPVHIVPVVRRHPGARFDLYHLGYPFVREALMIARSYPNVWLNLCGVQAESQSVVVDAVYEAADFLPAHKLVAFGADLHISVEKVYGHLVIAKENVSRGLARVVAEGRMSETRAIEMAKGWFYGNPKALYSLEAV